MLGCAQLYFVLVVLHFGPSLGSATSIGNAQGAGGFPHSVCQITTDAAPSDVTVSLEKDVDISGCVSRNVTVSTSSSPSAEVHVILLQWGSDVTKTALSPDSYASVTLDIRPFHKTGTYEKPLIFVLSSNIAIKWNVRTERIAKSSRKRFWVDRGSRVTRIRSNGSRQRIQRVSMPHDASTLLSWCQRRWHAVTSLTTLTVRAHTVYKQVGIDESAPAVCTLSPTLHSPASRATYLQQQTTVGCMTPTQTDTQVVHVFELLAAPVSSDHKSTVELSLQAVGTPPRTNIVLVLRSAQPVCWHITAARNLRGYLDVITEDEVLAGENGLERVRVSAERLRTFTGTALVSWVLQQNYGSQVRYVQVEIASVFSLLLGSQSSLSKVDTDLKRVLEQSKRVDCQSNSMLVALQKSLLQTVGVNSVDRLHIGDCSPQDNGTHFVFSLPLSPLCDTSRQVLSNGVVYSNAIQLDDVLQSEHTRRHEARHSDDISTHFSCGYLSDSLVLSADNDQNSNMQYQINIYKDETYSSNYTHYPHQIAENDIMFIEARIAADPTLGVMIENCSVASADTNELPHYLIKTGCRLEKRMMWYHSASTPGSTIRSEAAQVQRFSFKYYKYWQNSFYTYLQCQLVICSLVPSFSREHCMPQEQYCVIRNTYKRNAAVRNLAVTNTHVVYGGPMLLITPQTSTNKSTVPIVEKKPANQTLIDNVCDQEVTVQGLDSSTVIAIAFAAFFIGVLLTAALWYIHNHTGVIASHLTRHQRCHETSGDSTPSSTAPITVHQVHH